MSGFQKNPVYLDSNAGAPLHPKVREALRELPFGFYNPSSAHLFGRQARSVLNEARLNVARSLGIDDVERILFTSSGTEANQVVIRSVLAEAAGQEWLVSAVEHESVRQMIPWFEKRGGRVRVIPVDPNGLPRWDELEGLVTASTRLVSCLWVNNETGVVVPVERLSAICREKSVPLHLDSAQAWGKIPIHLDQIQADWFTFSGSKIGAFSGTGVILSGSSASRERIQPLLFGKQERGLRGGTENLIGAYSLGVAASAQDLKAQDRLRLLRDQMENTFIATLGDGVQINGKNVMRVSQTSNLSFSGVSSDALVGVLDMKGFAVSRGSACSSGVSYASHVLLAMGRSLEQARSSIRVSLHPEISEADIDRWVAALVESIQQMRQRIGYGRKTEQQAAVNSLLS